jgi:ATP-dependent DNA helicase RecG
VGRGERRAHCILLVTPDLPPETLSRLRQFAHTADGFAVAELDLAARGPGELLGADQHGFGGFRVAHPLRDRDLVLAARQIADDLLAADPELTDAAPALRAAVRRRLRARFPGPAPRASGG